MHTCELRLAPNQALHVTNCYTRGCHTPACDHTEKQDCPRQNGIVGNYVSARQSECLAVESAEFTLKMQD